MAVIERLDEVLPIAVGAKIALKVALCPSVNVSGSCGPVTVKRPPVAIVFVIVKTAVPEFVRVRICLPLEPIATLPKLRFVVLAARFPDVAVHPDSVRPTNTIADSTRRMVEQAGTL